jgi:hypothetical protein
MIKKKNMITALLLSFFFGTFGIDRFYLGCYATGFFKLITLGGFGLWSLVDFIRIASGSRLCGGFSWDDKIHKISDNKYIKTDLIFIFVSLAIGILLFFVIPALLYYYIGKKAQVIPKPQPSGPPRPPGPIQPDQDHKDHQEKIVL